MTKDQFVKLHQLIDMGFNIYATSGTFNYLADAGIVCSKINK